MRDDTDQCRHERQHGRAIAAIVLALVGTACTTGAPTIDDTSATPPSADAVAESSPTATPSTPDEDADPGADEPAGDDDVLTLEFTEVPEGTWRVESLGTPFEVEIEGEWWVQPNGNGWTVFTAADSRGPGDRDVVIIRPTGLWGSASANDPDWPVDDIEGWLDSASGVVATDPTTTEVGGVDGIVFEVEVEGERPVGFVDNAGISGKRFIPDHRYVVYWLDQGGLAPISIVVGAEANAFEDWAATATSLLDTISFGEPAPHPST